MRIEFMRIACYYSDGVIAMPKKPREMEQDILNDVVEKSIRKQAGLE